MRVAPCDDRKVFTRDVCRLFAEVVSGLQIPTEEPHLALTKRKRQRSGFHENLRGITSAYLLSFYLVFQCQRFTSIKSLSKS
jgi:hypothetical protein